MERVWRRKRGGGLGELDQEQTTEIDKGISKWSARGERRMPAEALSDPRLIHFLRPVEALGSVGKVDYGCHVVVLKDITDVKVEVS